MMAGRRLERDGNTKKCLREANVLLAVSLFELRSASRQKALLQSLIESPPAETPWLELGEERLPFPTCYASAYS
jgi:hypothetical protein